MSDPVTHTDIEDVLSSIRRLVKNSNKTIEKSPEQGAATASVGRLVLTPALRVSDTELDGVQTNGANAEDLTTEHGADAAPAPDANHIEANHIHVETTQEARAPDNVVTEFTSRQSAANKTRTRSVPLDTRDDLTADKDRVPQEAATVSAPVSEAVRSDIDQQEQHRSVQEDAPWHDPSATLFEAAAGEERMKSGAASERAAAVLRRIAELETAQKQASMTGETAPGAETLPRDAQDEASKELPPSLDEKLSALKWETPEDVQKPRADNAPQPDFVEADKIPTPKGAFTRRHMQGKPVPKRDVERVSPDEELLDEETLRELVAEIVRNELQGPLGERITRNVRKLVRREIQRALASQELF